MIKILTHLLQQISHTIYFQFTIIEDITGSYV